MSVLSALYFDGQQARGQPVTLDCENGILLLRAEELQRDIPLSEVKLSPRLGRTRRQLQFADGAVCELDDDPLLDIWFDSVAGRRWNLLAKLEAHWGMVLLAAGLVLSLMAALAVWGLPWAAKQVARQMPEAWVQQLGAGTLAGMDQALGDGSELPPARQAELSREFGELARAADVKAHFEFRHWPQLGANALALPDGTIVMTDELVALAQDDRELEAVIAHELGHVHERHALQKVLASSGFAAILFVLTGDVSGLSSIVVAAPAVITHLHHSRELEADADRFGFALMRKQGLDPSWFAVIIRKLEASHAGEKKKEGDAAVDETSNWLRSHPASEERARRAESFSRPAAD